MDRLFFKVYRNKKLYSIINSFLPVYIFERKTTEITGSSKWKSIIMNGGDKDIIRITKNKSYMVGGCWAKKPILFNQDLTFSFDFQMIKFGTETGADGIAVVFLKEPHHKCDINTYNKGHTMGYGGEMGYSGYLSGIAAIEFDCYYNLETHDPNSNHISIQTNDKENNWLSEDGKNSICHASPEFKMNNGEIHRVNILFNNKNKSFSVILNYKLYIDNITIPKLKDDKIEKVYVGVTGATAYFYQKQTISNFQVLKTKHK